MSNISGAYKCGECGTWHDRFDYATECCAPAVIEGWRCDDCNAYHVSEPEARNCCMSRCKECGEYNDDPDEICAHCGHDKALDPIPPEQLEIYGQRRLLI